MAICLDSDFIIDFLNGKIYAVEFFNKYRNSQELVSTEINKFEIFSGIYSRKVFNEEDKFSASGFFDSLSILSFDDSCGEISAKIFASLSKVGLIIGEADIFIASIMKKNGCNQIITRNVKDFSRIEGIEVISY